MNKLIVSLAALSSLLFACTPRAGSVAVSDDSEKVFQEKTISRFGLRGTKKVVLTYDDGPVAGATEPLLDLLKAEGIRGTFFMIGKRAAAEPAIMKRVQREGHIIANHTEDHISLKKPQFSQSRLSLISEIALAHNAILPYLIQDQKLYFRAPQGDWRSSHAAILNSIPQLSSYIGPVYWDEGGELNPAPQRGVPYHVSPNEIRGAADWACWQHGVDVKTCAIGYLREIEAKQGGVVLMHTVDNRSTQMSKIIIRELKRLGYQFLSLDDVEVLDQYE